MKLNARILHLAYMVYLEPKHNSLLARHTHNWHDIYKVGIISGGTWHSPLGNSPLFGKIPPLFLIPSYLLGIPPLRIVRFPSTVVPGCLCTDLPPPFFLPIPLSPTAPHFKYMPSYEDITMAASHSPIQE
jgi:hypothetical protein